MRTPRLRFSLRTLLLVTALAAVACYWWIALPRTTARRFASAVEAGDYSAAEAMCLDEYGKLLVEFMSALPSGYDRIEVAVRLQSRSLADLWHREQRLELLPEEAPADDSGREARITGRVVFQFVATSQGVYRRQSQHPVPIFDPVPVPARRP